MATRLPARPLTALQQYVVVTGAYWAFTLSDGALRMLVVFHFHQLGYSTLEIAILFLFYEFFGIVTNLAGGWLGARFGLRLTLWAGMVLQILALLMLVPVSASWPKVEFSNSYKVTQTRHSIKLKLKGTSCVANLLPMLMPARARRKGTALSSE